MVPPNMGYHMRFRTLYMEDPRLYNALPRSIRDHNGKIESFKKVLDKYLEDVPDQPSGNNQPDSINKNCTPSNSIIDWVCTLNLHNWIPIVHGDITDVPDAT